MYFLSSFVMVCMAIHTVLALPLPLQYGAAIGANQGVAYVNRVNIQCVFRANPKKDLTHNVGDFISFRCVGAFRKPDFIVTVDVGFGNVLSLPFLSRTVRIMVVRVAIRFVRVSLLSDYLLPVS